MDNSQDVPQMHDGSGGIQSLNAALRLLQAMTTVKGPLTLSEIAKQCDMPLSKAHRYLASFVQAGLVEQAGRSGKYNLGRGAVLLGLAALERHDFVNRAADDLPDLCAETGLTALLAVWGNNGATAVRWERGSQPTVTSIGLGTTLPLLNSATGRCFMVWGPQVPIRPVLEAELLRARKSSGVLPDMTPSPSGVEELRRMIRQAGYASVDGRFIPGLVAIAAPILDWQGEAQAVVTLIGTDPATARTGSDAVTKLLAFVQHQSIFLRENRQK
ncbi:IclR family transcriptional regulator [Rhizobium rhizogenes]|uniref:Transcriptional repressor protein n=2 Tax=Rhizobium/Agrobacterium group TaxID=227290 RepID=B9JM35_RHIR8|nr:IclR family transcriptional regulator [Rhizobium rhizogenes]ACM28749.1 transcriptional repressor protein [Rhizobium rhizogenes K84]EJK88045.1 transcriptional regulator [Rhizobium sp. AP16]OCJ18986.1 transcriptional regulator [Agrobacterium sp. B131/95]NTI24421.1 IclR family transcriptional regulator [Rhizobium rhizogenes]NTI43741.1 IclR family transcriptional regulator [Rhizobium rhizogenes]